MREKLNSNPLAQVALVGVLLVAAAVFLLSSSGKGGEEEAAGTAAGGSAAATTTAGAAGGAAAAAPPPGALAASAPPPPHAVTSAFAAGRTVVLLFVRKGGIDDRMVAAATRRLASLPEASTFVVPADSIARYAAIAQGVDVEPRAGARRAAPEAARPRRPHRLGQLRLPEPRRASNRRCVDAGYKGPTLDYHPLAAWTAREYPSHLRPVPDSGGSAAPALPPEAGGTPGLTPPLTRGRSSGFVTDVLVDLGYVSDDRARQAIEEARTAGRPPEQLLLQQGAVTADQLSRAVAERYGLDHVDLSAYHVDMAAANLISVNTARRYKALPVGFVDRETLLVAMADPTNVLAVDDIQIATGARLPRRGRRRGGRRRADRPPQHAPERRQRSGRRRRGRGRGGARRGQRHRSQRRGRAGHQARLQHPRPGGRGGRLRCPLRAGGGRDAGALPRRRGAARGGARAEADGQRGRLAGEDHERPQHRREAGAAGRPGQHHGRGPPRRPARDDAADPARRGGDDPHPRRRERPALARRARHGRPSARERFEASFRQAYGAVLVTGPTGSGKSTTLYAALQDLNQVEKKIITIEDPVEYRLRRRQPDQRQPQGGARLRHRPALDPARRPRHRDGRRDPRRRDGADRDRGGADRPHDADHPAHQRRPGRGHPPHQDGDRGLPHRLRGRLRRRPAARPQALHPLQAAHDRAAAGARRRRTSGSASSWRPTSRSAAAAATRAATAAGSGSTR